MLITSRITLHVSENKDLIETTTMSVTSMQLFKRMFDQTYCEEVILLWTVDQ